MNYAFLINQALIYSPVLALIGIFVAPKESAAQWFFYPGFFLCLGVIAAKLSGMQTLKESLPVEPFYSSVKACLKRHELLLCILFCAYFILSLLWSDAELGRMLSKYIRYSLYLISFIIMIDYGCRQSKDYFENIFNIILIAACLSSLAAIIVFVVNEQTLFVDRLYALGGLHNAVIAGMVYGFCALTALGMLSKQTDIKKKMVYGLLFTYFLAVVIATMSRGPFLALVIASLLLGAMLFLQKTDRRQRSIVMVLTLIGLLGVVMQLIHWQQGNRPIRMDEPRLQIWSKSIRSVDNLWVGNGIATDDNVILERPGKVDIEIRHPHSALIATYVYGGVVGLIFIALIVLAMLISLRIISASNVPNAMFLTSLLVFALIILTLDGSKLIAKVNYVWLVFWLPLALSIGLRKRSE